MAAGGDEVEAGVGSSELPANAIGEMKLRRRQERDEAEAVAARVKEKQLRWAVEEEQERGGEEVVLHGGAVEMAESRSPFFSTS